MTRSRALFIPTGTVPVTAIRFTAPATVESTSVSVGPLEVVTPSKYWMKARTRRPASSVFTSTEKVMLDPATAGA